MSGPRESKPFSVSCAVNPVYIYVFKYVDLSSVLDLVTHSPLSSCWAPAEAGGGKRKEREGATGAREGKEREGQRAGAREGAPRPREREGKGEREGQGAGKRSGSRPGAREGSRTGEDKGAGEGA